MKQSMRSKQNARFPPKNSSYRSTACSSTAMKDHKSAGSSPLSNEKQFLNKSLVIFPSTPAPQYPNSPSHMTTLLQHADYGHLLPAAHGLIAEHANMTRAHLLATGAAMEALAKRSEERRVGKEGRCRG